MKEYGMFTINEMVEFLTYHEITAFNINIYESFKRFCDKHNLMIADIVADIRRARLDALYEICKRVDCDWEDVTNDDFGAPKIDGLARAQKEWTTCNRCGGTCQHGEDYCEDCQED